MAIGLRCFRPVELLLSPAAAWEVLRFFFPADVVGVYPEDLGVEDRLFAQALLVAAIDETRALGDLEPSGEAPLVAAGWIRLRPIVTRIVSRGPEAWFSVAVPAGADPTRIHEAARAVVSIRHRAGWIAHVRGGPLL